MKLTEILAFLKELSENNNREWFQANKERYNHVRSEFELFINILIPELSQIDPEVKGLEAKECLFRIYRDIRFSPDKTPYKINFGAYMARGGRKSEFAGYYFHLEPGSSLLAGGVYLPQPPVLKAIREEIYHNTDEFLHIIKNPTFKRYFPEMDGEKLKTAPQGYPNDFEQIDWLKYKSYSLVAPLSNKALSSDNLVQEVCNVYRIMKPFNDFMNRVIDDVV